MNRLNVTYFCHAVVTCRHFLLFHSIVFFFCYQGDFVAAFAQSNEGDVSPNTKGPHCLDTGLPCDTNHSTCNGRVKFGSCPFFSTLLLHVQHMLYQSLSLLARRVKPIPFCFPLCCVFFCLFCVLLAPE